MQLHFFSNLRALLKVYEANESFYFSRSNTVNFLESMIILLTYIHEINVQIQAGFIKLWFIITIATTILKFWAFL